jgi:adenosylcobinamide kinase/adenosylcobinamide-phosphate guanylyltransferase
MRSRTPRQAAAWRALVLGGASSGKSAFAERLLAEDPEVLYAATAPRYEGDAEWAERIARHRATRPQTWRTVEIGDEPARLADLLQTADRAVLVDSLTLWLTTAMDAVCAWDDEAWRGGHPQKALNDLVTDLVAAYAASASSVVVVSDEIGFGRLNQALAAAADDVSLVVAGIALRLKQGPGSLNRE